MEIQTLDVKRLLQCEKVVTMDFIIRIFLLSVVFSIFWFIIQESVKLIFNYKVPDILIGIICVVIVLVFYEKIGLKYQ